MDVSVMNTTTTTITADVECFNGLRDLFMRFDLPDIKPIDLLKIEHVSSISIQFQQLSVLLGCAADAAACLVRCHTGSVDSEYSGYE